MRAGGFAAPLAAGLAGLVGALAITVFLHRAAAGALDQVLEARLRGAGLAVAGLLAGGRADGPRLRALMAASALEGALVIDGELRVIADATGPEGGRVDLLRVDRARVAAALRGEASVGPGWTAGEAQVLVGYFPVTAAPGAAPEAVLALEAGEAFGAGRERLRRALWAAVALSLVAAAALATGAWRWTLLEAARRDADARAVRGDAVARMAAMVAHEVRNPAGVVRGSVELVRARAGPALSPVDREALDDVLAEVQRLTRLTEDFLDLAREPRLSVAPVDLAAVAEDAARAARAAHAELAVVVAVPPLRVAADAARLHQVLGNLLRNASQAGAREVRLEGRGDGDRGALRIRDDGPGIDAALLPRLFEPFATARRDGTGLGLALARRLIERQGGTLRLAAPGPGAEFELTLPLAAS